MESIFAILLIPMVCLIVFGFRALSKLLEHKQIMAAIEKGMPLSELRPAKPAGSAWIKNLTAGIALFIIATGLVYVQFARGYDYDEAHGFFFIAVIIFAFGIARIIRGLLQRKTEKAQKQLPQATNSAIQ